MGKRYNGMTVAEHVQHGKSVVQVKSAIRHLLMECSSSFGTSNRATRYTKSVYDAISSLQSALDDEYLKVATQEDLDQYRFPYYEREMVRDD